MESKTYEKMILSRIESSINIILPLASLICFVGAYAVYVVESKLFFVTYNAAIGAVLLFLFFARELVSIRAKIIVLIVTSLVQGMASLYVYGINSSGVALLTISLILTIGFFTYKTGLIYSLVLFGLYITFPVMIHFGWIEYRGAHEALLNNPFEWGIHALVLLMLEIILLVVFGAIKKYLLDSMMDVDLHLDKIYHLAYYDQLTKLPNGNRFIEEMDEKKPKTGFLVLLNIRGLNLINSIYGTDLGDRVICHVGAALEKEKQIDECVAKIAGNEFVWHSLSKNSDDMLIRIGKLADVINLEADEKDIPTNIHFNAGFVEIDGEYDSISEVIQKAAMALEQAKIHKKYSVMNYDYELDEKFRSEEKIKNYLAQGISHNEFYISYQEKRDCTDNKVVGVEALARWESPTLGSVPPSTFIPIIDKANLSIVFGNMVIRKVLEEYRALVKVYGEDISVSINISPTHIASPEFSDFVIQETKKKGINPHHITLEITEDSLIENLDLMADVLRQLRIEGFKISLDDFGTGYSSLSYLSKLGFDELKIDKSFIQQLSDDQKTGTLIRTIINLKDTYGINIVAEGVETKKQSDMLLNFGCNVHQGYLFSKPSPLKNPK